ncbi:MAG: hypothetical protein V7K21_05340 [Nostoc sp.]
MRFRATDTNTEQSPEEAVGWGASALTGSFPHDDWRPLSHSYRELLSVL